MTALPVYLEIGSKRVFAAAVAWPGWCRSGRDEQSALAALASYRDRYAAVAQRANRRLPRPKVADFEVVERVQGSATTDFGAPGSVPALDHAPMSPKERGALAELVAAAWAEFDLVVAGAPSSLRKGPRGGGRDRDAIVAHVVKAEAAYARKIGLGVKAPAWGDRRATASFRAIVLDGVRSPDAGSAWPAPYAARRIAWHALDHAWEIQDKSEPA